MKIGMVVLSLGVFASALFAGPSPDMLVEYVQPYADANGNFKVEIGTKLLDKPDSVYVWTFTAGSTGVATTDVGKAVLSVALAALSAGSRVRLSTSSTAIGMTVVRHPGQIGGRSAISRD